MRSPSDSYEPHKIMSSRMRETLSALAAGDISVETAEARLAGYTTTAAGRFDSAREQRRGIPEGILAAGKTPSEVVELCNASIETTGRALVTRVDDATIESSEAATDAEPVTLTVDRRARTVIARANSSESPSLDVEVCIVTGGTSDYPAAGEAAAVLSVVGVDYTLIEDVGVANIDRLFDQLDRISETQVVIAVAGREAALPTVVAGQVSAPVIGVPVSTGYGHGGDGEAALSGLLQSCTALSVVNVDAGFTAGTQAALIAQAVDRGSE